MTVMESVAIEQPDEPAPIILAIDASGDHASVALWAAGKLLGQTQNNAKHGHAATLVPMVRDLLREHGVVFSALTHIAGGVGPGSFTGIRVALATAKGFCLATGATPIGVSVLAANAYAAAKAGHNKGCDMVILADTRRRSVYAQRFNPSGDANSDIIEANSGDVLSDLAVGSVVLAVAGAMHSDVLASSDIRHFAMGDLPVPDASQIAVLAAAKISNDVSLDPLTPLYLAPAFLGPKRVA